MFYTIIYFNICFNYSQSATYKRMNSKSYLNLGLLLFQQKYVIYFLKKTKYELSCFNKLENSRNIQLFLLKRKYNVSNFNKLGMQMHAEQSRVALFYLFLV